MGLKRKSPEGNNDPKCSHLGENNNQHKQALIQTQSQEMQERTTCIRANRYTLCKAKKIISMVYSDGENKRCDDSSSSGRETRGQDPSLCEKGRPSREDTTITRRQTWASSASAGYPETAIKHNPFKTNSPDE